MRFSNVGDYDMTVFHLARQGYGSVKEIREWDTPQFLDAVEYEQICSDIELYKIEESRNAANRARY